MKHLFLLILLPVFTFSQELKILSKKDKTPVPFAFITISSNVDSWQAITDVNGLISISNNLNIKDSSVYKLEIKSIGYVFYSNKLNGFELKK